MTLFDHALTHLAKRRLPLKSTDPLMWHLYMLSCDVMKLAAQLL